MIMVMTMLFCYKNLSSEFYWELSDSKKNIKYERESYFVDYDGPTEKDELFTKELLS